MKGNNVITGTRHFKIERTNGMKILQTLQILYLDDRFVRRV